MITYSSKERSSNRCLRHVGDNRKHANQGQILDCGPPALVHIQFVCPGQCYVTCEDNLPEVKCIQLLKSQMAV